MMMREGVRQTVEGFGSKPHRGFGGRLALIPRLQVLWNSIGENGCEQGPRDGTRQRGQRRLPRHKALKKLDMRQHVKLFEYPLTGKFLVLDDKNNETLAYFEDF